MLLLSTGLVLLMVLALVGNRPASTGTSASEPSAGGSGSAGTTSAPLRIAALGDSVAAANACDCTDFVTLAGRDLTRALRRTVTVDNLARGGNTTEDVLEELDQPSVRTVIAEADAVIIEIGANDFSEGDAYSAQCLPPNTGTCMSGDLAAVRTRLTDIVQRVQNLQGTGGYVALLGYWNIFRDGASAQAEGETYVTASRAMTTTFNTMVRQVATARGAGYIDASTPLLAGGDPTDLLAPDGDHPNALGQQRLADAVTDALEVVLRPAGNR